MLTKGPRCHSRGITGYGWWTENGVAFVGIAPGQDEFLHSGTPFTGPAGQLLDAVLESCGWTRERVYTTNLLCWWKDAPDLGDIWECWPRLQAELQDLKPKLIIPLGQIATDFLLGNIAGNVKVFPDDWKGDWAKIKGEWPEGEEYPSFGSRRGRTTWSTALNAYVMPTYHTAAVLRGGPYFISDIVRDLSKIGLVLNEFKPDGLEAGYDYRVASSLQEGRELLGFLESRSRSGELEGGVALDIETNYGEEDIDVFTEDLLCLSLTWGWNDTCVIPGEVAKQLDWTGLSIKWIGQNFPFDSNGIRQWVSRDVSLPVREDTLLESYALDERPGRHRLEILGGEWCAAPFWKSALGKYHFKEQYVDPVTNRKRTRDVKRVPLEVLYKYNAGDTTYTYRSHHRQRPRLTAEGMERMYTELLVPAANAFKDIQYRGVWIDQQRQSQLMVDWCELWLEQEEELRKIAIDLGWPEAQPLNFRSNKDMPILLYDVMGLPVQYHTNKKTGEKRVTTDKDALIDLKVLFPDHPFLDLFHHWRQTDHQISVSEGIGARIKLDGFLHAIPQPTGTETGRLSYRDPNLQNIAQDWMVGANLARIREIFAPANPETHFLMEADYKQIELWMAVQWSHDPNMLSDLMSGDFHKMTAADVNNKRLEEVTRADRFGAKAVTFGKLYDRSAADMLRGQSSLKVSLYEAQLWCKRWEDRYAGYMEWSASLKRQAQDDGIIVSPWGRKRRYYLVMGEEAHHMLRSAVNFCMQSTAHDYTLTALIQLQEQLWQYDSYILIESHDAILIEASKKYAKEVFALVKQVMESVRPNSDWPLLQVEFKSGPNWGLCKEGCKICGGMYPHVTVKEVELSPSVSELRCTNHLPGAIAA